MYNRKIDLFIVDVNDNDDVVVEMWTNEQRTTTMKN